MKLVTRTYVAVVGSLLLFLIATILLITLIGGRAHRNHALQVAENFQTQVLPELDFHSIRHHPRAKKRARRLIREFSREYRAKVFLFDSTHRPILRPEKPPFDRFRDFPRLQEQMQRRERILQKRREKKGTLAHFMDKRRTIHLDLVDGHTAEIHVEPPPLDVSNFGWRLLISLGVLFLCSGLIAYPLTKRLTKRLEKLSQAVTHWGEKATQGSTERLTVDKNILTGNDEIAELAQRFEQASERIATLIDANRLLLANASHEIRTPLTRIRLNVEMLENLISSDNKEDFTKRETAIKRNLIELDDLVESILQSSRLDAQDKLEHPENIDLTGLIKSESEHYPDAVLNLSSDVYVLGQRNLLVQLLRNLLNNAYKHGEAPVYINLTTDVVEKQSSVILTVTDSGNGIPADKLTEIFKPFVRLSNNNKGNGLGLNLVKKIVELHGGQVTVENGSEDAQGACFIIKIPQQY